MSNGTSTAPKGWILYDGSCGICARWVPSWSGTLASFGLGVAALQEPWVAERTGLGPAELTQDIRLLHATGEQVVGADVYRYVLRRLWWATPVYLLSIAPGARRLFDAAYRAFAARRHRLSSRAGLIPSAAREPVDCK
jgi:predicted DCC family thiol-disulfide oxidoreductase YuxK